MELRWEYAGPRRCWVDRTTGSPVLIFASVSGDADRADVVDAIVRGYMATEPGTFPELAIDDLRDAACALLTERGEGLDDPAFPEYEEGWSIFIAVRVV